MSSDCIPPAQRRGAGLIQCPSAEQVQQGRDDVTMDFALDDTGGDREDALVAMTFHVPKDAEEWQDEGDADEPSVKVGRPLACRLCKAVCHVDSAKRQAACALCRCQLASPCRSCTARWHSTQPKPRWTRRTGLLTVGAAKCLPVQVLHDALAQHTAQGAATGEAVASFDNVGLLAPRGRFEVEMFVSSMTLSGQVLPCCASYSPLAFKTTLSGRGPSATAVLSTGMADLQLW